MKNFFDFLLSLLFPRRCAACAKRWEKSALCPDCRSRINIRHDFLCPICRRRLPEPFARCHPENGFLLFAAVSFSEKEVRELVHSLKYAGRKEAAKDMANILADAAKDKLFSVLRPESSFLVPIPLHRDKERARGFNQSRLLAEETAIRLGGDWPTVNFLERTINNKSQTECRDKKERAENVRNIFKVLGDLKNKDLILIDDVLTSGATLREAVKTLKAAGAGRLIALVFAEA